MSEQLLRAQAALIKSQQEYIDAIMNAMIEKNIASEQQIAYVENVNYTYKKTFKECAEHYLESRKATMRASSYVNHVRTLEKIIFPEIGDVYVENIKSNFMQKFVNKMSTRYSRHTIKDYVGLIKTILNFCETDEYAQVHKFSIKLPKEIREEYEVLSDEDCEKIYTHALETKKENHVAVVVALETGLRIGEVCGLTWGDVDFADNIIHVKRTVQRIYDSETKKSYINIGETKTNAGTRIVPMTVKLANILKEIRTEEKIYVASGRERPTEPRTLRQAFDRLLDKLEIKHIKFHGLRHTFSTRAIKAGVDPKTLAKILGHENCNITLDIYTSVTKEMLQKGIEKLA